MASSVSAWGRKGAGYVEKAAFCPLAEEKLTAQLTEHAHKPLLLRPKRQVGVQSPLAHLLLFPGRKMLDLNLRTARMNLAGPRKVGIGSLWESGFSGQELALRQSSFDWKVVSSQLRRQMGSDSSVKSKRPAPCPCTL